MSNIISAANLEADNQCMLQKNHDEEEYHKLPKNETDHKCTGTLECGWCSGYWLPEFDRCKYRLIQTNIWLNFDMENVE